MTSPINLLITGGAGFIGSNFIEYFLPKNKNCHIINLDLLTYAGNLDNLSTIANHPRYTFIKGDICDRDLVSDIFEKYHINTVIHFAAESHVDNSIVSPETFIHTNINGTHTLLDIAFQTWFEKPFVAKNLYKEALFYHISTDEVFGSLGESGYFNEDSQYAPNSPYSASKASSDMLVRAYAHTYGLNALITNCSNNYGPNQHDEKLIPTIIRHALMGREIPIYGNGCNIRDWLFVQDHCRAIEQVFYYGLELLRKQCNIFDRFVIGGNEEWRNIDIATMICKILDTKIPKNNGSYVKQIQFVNDRYGHDCRYAIDSSKIQDILGFQIQENFIKNLTFTIEYFINRYEGGVAAHSLQ